MREPCAEQAIQRLVGVLELDRGVAGVEADAEVTAQDVLGAARSSTRGPVASHCARGRREQLALEEVDGFARGLEEAAGLGLERERDVPAACDRRTWCSSSTRSMSARPICAVLAGVWTSRLKPPGTVLMLPLTPVGQKRSQRARRDRRCSARARPRASRGDTRRP